jgi:uncharacterized protein (TIGR00369 family)
MPSIWKQPVSIERLASISRATAVEHLGIEFLVIGEDFLSARVPVDQRTRQPYGFLHGGVAVVLAETLASCGAACACAAGHRVVGLEINANHLRSATQGWVTGTARALHIGGSTHVWQVELRDDEGRMTCISRVTMAVLKPSAGQSSA